MRARTFLLTLLVTCLLPAGTAAAASKFTIRGAGFGHGVGMSQYGAYGFALNGSGYRDILAHYYTGTAIGTLDPNQRVRVLLQSVRGLGVVHRRGARRPAAAVVAQDLLRAPPRRGACSCARRAASAWAPTARCASPGAAAW